MTWQGVVGHIPRRWAHARTQMIALSPKKGGTGAQDVVLHPQSLYSFEAGMRSVISTRRLCPLSAGSK